MGSWKVLELQGGLNVFSVVNQFRRQMILEVDEQDAAGCLVNNSFLTILLMDFSP